MLEGINIVKLCEHSYKYILFIINWNKYTHIYVNNIILYNIVIVEEKFSSRFYINKLFRQKQNKVRQLYVNYNYTYITYKLYILYNM